MPCPEKLYSCTKSRPPFRATPHSAARPGPPGSRGTAARIRAARLRCGGTSPAFACRSPRRQMIRPRSRAAGRSLAAGLAMDLAARPQCASSACTFGDHPQGAPSTTWPSLRLKRGRMGTGVKHQLIVRSAPAGIGFSLPLEANHQVQQRGNTPRRFLPDQRGFHPCGSHLGQQTIAFITTHLLFLFARQLAYAPFTPLATLRPTPAPHVHTPCHARPQTPPWLRGGMRTCRCGGIVRTAVCRTGRSPSIRHAAHPRRCEQLRSGRPHCTRSTGACGPRARYAGLRSGPRLGFARFALTGGFRSGSDSRLRTL